MERKRVTKTPWALERVKDTGQFCRTQHFQPINLADILCSLKSLTQNISYRHSQWHHTDKEKSLECYKWRPYIARRLFCMLIHAKEKRNGLPNGMARSFYSLPQTVILFFHPVSCQWPPANQEKVRWQKLMSQKIRELCLSPFNEGKWPTSAWWIVKAVGNSRYLRFPRRLLHSLLSLNETHGINLFYSHFILNSLDVNCPSMLKTESCYRSWRKWGYYHTACMQWHSWHCCMEGHAT